MRIISGSARGKRLTPFSGKDIRPTPDRVRGAIYNILFSQSGPMDGKKVLDLFAGSGAMGLEAASRGAEAVYLVDSSPQAATVEAANIKACNLEKRCHQMRGDVFATLPRLGVKGPFDLIFLDPPYAKGLVEQALNAISSLNLLSPDGIICAESASTDDVPGVIGTLTRTDQRTYGSTTIHFFNPRPVEADRQ